MTQNLFQVRHNYYCYINTFEMVHIQRIYSDKNFIKINRETNTPLNQQQTLSSSNRVHPPTLKSSVSDLYMEYFKHKLSLTWNSGFVSSSRPDFFMCRLHFCLQIQLSPTEPSLCRLIWCYTHVNQTQDLLIWQNSEVTLPPTPVLLLFLTDIIYCIRCLIY